MYPGHWAQLTPDKPAHVMSGSGEAVTFAELEDRSRRLAQLWWAAGLRPGDHVALLMENNPRYPEVFWAAARSGLYITTVNRYLVGDELAYVVDNCEARSLVTSWALRDAATSLLGSTPRVESRLMVDGMADGHDRYEEAIAAHPAERLDDEPAGEAMLYSSGTTGRPKGIKRPLTGRKISDPNPATMLLLGGLFSYDEHSVYLSPAPMYHSAPLGFSMGTQALGGTVVMMERFDPIEALAAIERFYVTHSQWVPTMFVRMLKLEPAERERFDLSSMKVVIHAAAPCPVPVKQQMIEWWGPIIHEYYGGTELNGFTYVNAEDWLAHPGTVGRSVLGTLHVCDDDGNELPPGEPGVVYFELPALPFEYFKDAGTTRGICHPDHPTWSALGDVGYVDEDGFLYLTDRATFMIISGGVNIYPQEIENVIITHPRVVDVAVIGVPNDEFGEEVKAVVQPLDWADAGPDLARDLDAYCRERLAHFKCPRSFDFEEELPRLPTGKLYKRLIRDRYWGTESSRILASGSS